MARLIITFTGRNGQGSITSLTGLKVGDEVLHVLHPSGADQAGQFAAFVTVDDELVQVSASDNSANTYHALLERHVMIP